MKRLSYIPERVESCIRDRDNSLLTALDICHTTAREDIEQQNQQHQQQKQRWGETIHVLVRETAQSKNRNDGRGEDNVTFSKQRASDMYR